MVDEAIFVVVARGTVVSSWADETVDDDDDDEVDELGVLLTSWPSTAVEETDLVSAKETTAADEDVSTLSTAVESLELCVDCPDVSLTSGPFDAVFSVTTTAAGLAGPAVAVVDASLPGIWPSVTTTPDDECPAELLLLSVIVTSPTADVAIPPLPPKVVESSTTVVVVAGPLPPPEVFTSSPNVDIPVVVELYSVVSKCLFVVV